MGIGVGIVLIVIGAILLFALNSTFRSCQTTRSASSSSWLVPWR